MARNRPSSFPLVLDSTRPLTGFFFGIWNLFWNLFWKVLEFYLENSINLVDATTRVIASVVVRAYGARTHHARAPHPNPPLPLVITPPSPPSSPTRARGGGGCGGGRSRHVASRRMERGAPQRHQPPETVGLPKYPPDQTNRVWRVARDGVSALARGGRRSFSPTRDGRNGEWAGGQETR